MKKTIAILLCVLLLVVNIIPFASAEEVHTHNEGVGVPSPDYMNLQGKFRFNDTIDFPDSMIDLLQFNYIPFYSPDFDSVLTMFTLGGPSLDYINDFGDAVTVYDGTWLIDSARILTFYIENDDVPTAFVQWLRSNSTEVFCDGSTCNLDGLYDGDICPSCGAKVMRLSAPPSNEVTYPSNLPLPPSEVLNGDYEIIVMNYNGVTKLYGYINTIPVNGSEPLYYVWGNSNNNDVILEATKSSATGNAYELVADQWVYSGILSGDYTIGKFEDIVYSSTIIYDENGEYFFPLTLWAQILKVAQGEMNLKTIPMITDSAVSLVLCGIGCLALLILLPILVKVLRRFLTK